MVLIGLPGSGKSSVGRRLAQRLDFGFSDSDTVIEQRLGCSIRDYFEREGEAAFRDVEQQVLAELAASVQGVVATGGGAVLREANRRALQDHFHVIYLRSSPEDLLKRLRHDTKRPLLQVADPLARLRELHDQRDPLYRATAHSIVDTGRPSIAMLVNTIVMQLELSGIVTPPPPAAGGEPVA
ncbi:MULTISPECIES: shikimate kinase [unclassified Variovorax]|uniref:shikimate kinase n=1 Tax=unclassified Variovorax TaxID=663243 RepID=UPI0025768915|nr:MULTISPECIES: shikimate kinase [unclassified Variovorax]MDM0088392.1 shikimate kinase [Variovorax sp. J22G40]MDM0146465.1 shikimate kinase [Variovorax sp. J2P1-31]